MHNPWRVGRSLGRTIYEQVGPEASKKDIFLGIMDSRELAAFVVYRVNLFCRDAKEFPRAEIVFGNKQYTEQDFIDSLTPEEKRKYEQDIARGGD